MDLPRAPVPAPLLKGLFHLSNFIPDVSYYEAVIRVMGKLKTIEEYCLPASSYIVERAGS